MNFNLEKIEEIYGREIFNCFKDNQDDVINNIKYFYNLGFNDIEDIFERVPLLFVKPYDDFKIKIDELLIKLGTNYVEIIENDLSILEELI